VLAVLMDTKSSSGSMQGWVLGRVLTPQSTDSMAAVLSEQAVHGSARQGALGELTWDSEERQLLRVRGTCQKLQQHGTEDTRAWSCTHF
jgi:hypothetical protein